MGNTLTVTTNLEAHNARYGRTCSDSAVNRAMANDSESNKAVVERRLADLRKALWIWHVDNANDWSRHLIAAGIAGGILASNRHLEGSDLGRIARGTGLIVLCAHGLLGSASAFAGAGILAQLARHK